MTVVSDGDDGGGGSGCVGRAAVAGCAESGVVCWSGIARVNDGRRSGAVAGGVACVLYRLRAKVAVRNGEGLAARGSGGERVILPDVDNVAGTDAQ